MTARKRPRRWDATFRRICVHYWPQFNYPPRTSTKELDAAEKELNFRFPDSYRAFAEEFGLGGIFICSLPHLLPLNQPSWAGKGAWFHSVLDATQFYRTHNWAKQLRTNDTNLLSFLQRVIVFGMVGGYHHWVFDPNEVTNSRRREYRIYDYDRVGNTTVIADSFDGWLQYIDRSYRFPDDDEPSETEPEFLPVYLPSAPEDDSIIYFRDTLDHKSKKAPKRGVKKWLIWNDGTVRILAETIRHQQRPDLFPILADALEDAGCTSADVLRSCRTGNPAVDGVWVLQVLLGKTATR